METFKRGDLVVTRQGVSGVVQVPAYEKVPYVQVNFGTHTGWCYPHELTLESDHTSPHDSDFAEIPEWDLDETLSDKDVPQYAKDVLYGYREGYKACEAQIKALATPEPEPAPKLHGMADVYTEANNQRKMRLKIDIAEIIYDTPDFASFSTCIKAAERVLGTVRACYPDVE